MRPIFFLGILSPQESDPGYMNKPSKFTIIALI